MDKTKPYKISKHVVLEAFEANLKNNLYKLWNRMSSGSYFPLPVKAVEIPKKNGGETYTRSTHSGRLGSPNGCQNLF